MDKIAQLLDHYREAVIRHYQGRGRPELIGEAETKIREHFAVPEVEPQLRVEFRPLLVNGMLATEPKGRVILIDSEQSQQEQAISLYHEMLHLIGLKDEEKVEDMAQQLAEAVPWIIEDVKSLEPQHGE